MLLVQLEFTVKITYAEENGILKENFPLPTRDK
jgi:hypothetical protein